MKRRDVLRAMSAVALAPMAVRGMAAEGAPQPGSHKTAAGRIRLGDSFFLSKTNPVATADQREMEALALKILQMPIVTKAKAEAAQRFKILAGHDVPAEAWLGFDDRMEEWALHYVLLAVNSDPNYPKVLGSVYGPPHEWFGMKLPGNRGPGTGENVDNNYTIIPLDGHARFELHGRRLDPPIGDCPFHVTGNLSQAMNISSLLWRDVKVDTDGGFVISIDSKPANGRPNHLRTDEDARYLFIRDGRVDWHQTPNAYRIRRLDPPTAPPQSVDHVAERAARFIVDDVAMNYWFRQMVAFLDVNTVSPPQGSGFFGGQPSQKLGRGHIRIDDDEAFVLTLGSGGAGYWLIVSYDYWLMSGDYWSRSSSLNNSQSLANDDGSYTYVFSIRDPGVHNWIDTLGLHESLFFIRWQQLPRVPVAPEKDTFTKGELVKLDDLDRVLPAGAKRVTAEERRLQLAERLALFRRRYAV